MMFINTQEQRTIRSPIPIHETIIKAPMKTSTFGEAIIRSPVERFEDAIETRQGDYVLITDKKP